jgi:hypothetical protein
MGYSVILDIIGSAITGGLLVLTLLSFNAQNAENKQMFRDDIIAQRNLVNTVTTIEEDFRRAGYCASKSNMALPIFTIASAETVQFKTDLPVDSTGHHPDGDGIVDRVMFAFGGDAPETINIHDRHLYRQRSGRSREEGGSGVTEFRIRYLKSRVPGDTLATPVTGLKLTEIAAVDIMLRVETPNPMTPAVLADSLAVRTPMNWKLLHFEVKNYGKGAY